MRWEVRGVYGTESRFDRNDYFMISNWAQPIIRQGDMAPQCHGMAHGQRQQAEAGLGRAHSAFNGDGHN